VTAFALGSVDRGAGPIPVVVHGDDVYHLRAFVPGVARTADLFAEWDAALDRISQGLAAASTAPISSTGLRAAGAVLPPVQPIGPVFAAGVNYREHIIQMSVAHKLGVEGADDEQLRADAAAGIDRRVRVGDPYVWTGLASAVSGAYDDVQLPDFGGDVDWELELGVVIGRTCHRVSRDEALDHVAGYTIVNDISARSLIPRPDIAGIGTDWFRAKNQPTFFPTGPVLVPARFVPDPADLRIRLRVNDELMQDASTADMAFDVPALISYASSIAILRAGDLLITGSPAGNGSHFGRFLQAGDVIDGSISGLGAQRTVVRAPSGIDAPWQASRRAAQDAAVSP
jgi:2,4-didehydro-3-deoxy-L-rhamnonate hydrolase